MKYKIKELMNVYRGASPRPIIEYLSDTGYRWLKISDFKLYNRYVYDTKEYIIEEGVKKTRYMSKGTLILTNSATPGIPIFLANDMCLHDGFLYFQNIKQDIINIKFLYYWFLYNREKIVSQANGSVFQNLKKEIVENYEIDIPDINEQLKIVKILDNISDKIDINNQTNDNLHEYCENLFKSVYKQGVERKIGDLITNIETGSRPKGGAQQEGIPSIGAEKIEKFGVYDFSSEKYINKEYFDKLNNGIVKSKDVLLYKDGAYTGKVSLALDDFPHKKCAINEHVFKINSENNFAQYYLYFCLFNEKNRQKVFTLASAKAAQPGLNQNELKSLKVKIPNREAIIKFEKDVDSIMHLIVSNSKENKRLDHLRNMLLPKLMNGEIDLDNM